MKNKFTFILLMLMALAMGVQHRAMAQSSVTIGLGDFQDWTSPIGGHYGYHHSAMLYTTDELTGMVSGSTITSMAFHLYTVTAGSVPVSIWLYETPNTYIDSSLSWTQLTSAATQVFSQSIDPLTDAWAEVTFDFPYTYQGGNLVLLVYSEGCTTSGGCPKWGYFTDGFLNTGQAYICPKDGSPNNESSPLSTYSRRENGRYKSDVRFDFVMGAISCYPVGVITVSNISSNSAEVAWGAPVDAGSYILQYKLSSQAWNDPDVVTDYPTDTTYDFNGLLSPMATYNVRVANLCSNGDTSVWRTATFTTDCGAISTLPFNETFDTQTSGSVPQCWSVLNTYNGYPSVTTTYTHGGSGKCLEFVCDYSSVIPQFAVMPVFEADLSQLQLKFWSRREGASSGTLQVGYMTDPQNAATFHALDSVSSASMGNNDYQQTTVNYGDVVTSSDTTYYIAFRYLCGNNWYWFVDDITVDYIPSCAEPTQLAATLVLADEATLTWNGGNSTTFNLYYKTAADTAYNVMESVSLDANDEYQLYGLNPATLYTWYVGALCDDGTISNSNYASFTTPCATFQAPFMENFNTLTSGIPMCWDNSEGTTTSDSYKWNYNASGASGACLRFDSYFNSNGNTNMLKTPVLDLTTLSVPQLSFSYKNPSGGDFSVYVSTDGGLTYPTVLATGLMNMSTWSTVEFVLDPSVATSNVVIVFKGTSNYGSGDAYIYLDNVSVQEAPNCPVPSALTAHSPSDVVYLSWNDPVGSLWDVVYGPVGFDPDTSASAMWITGVSTTSTEITGLNPGETYEFYVRSDCGGEYSDWTSESAITTLNTYTMGVTGSDTITGCNITIVDDGGVNGDYSNNCEYILVVYPETSNTLVSISGTFAGEGSADYLEIYDGVSTSVADRLEKVTSTMNGASSGTQVTFGPYTSQSGPLTIRFHSDYSVVYPGFVAHVTCVDPPTCSKPVNLTVEDLASNTATISWQTLTDTYIGFNYVLSEIPIVNPDSASDVMNTSTTSVDLTNLTPNTTYYLQVQTDCGGGDVSDWSNVLSFTTSCVAIDSIPYAEGFDTYGTGDNTYPTCWFKINTYSSNRPYVTSTAYNGAGSLYFFAGSGTYNMAIMPMIDANIPINSLQATFMYKGTYESDRLIVGVMTNPADATTFVPVDTVFVDPSASSWVAREVFFNQYQGAGHYIAFKNEYTTTYGYAYIDQLVIDYIPTCPKPNHLVATAITTTSVDLSWVEAGVATEWEVVYGTPGFDPDSLLPGQIVNSNTFTAQGLTPSTAYEFYVRSSCSATDQSMWSSPVTVTTRCESLNLPYTENFNSYTTTSTSSTTPAGYPNDELPMCWDFLNRSTSSSSYPSVFITGYSSYASSGNCLFFKSSNTTPLYAILPAFDQPLNTMQISFSYRNEGTGSSNGTLSLGYMNNPADASSFVEIATYPQTTTITDITEVLDTISYALADARLAFKYTGGDYSNYYLGLDNVFVELIPTCPRPTQLTATSASSSVTLAWTNGGSETEWNIEYGEAGFTPGTGTVVVANSNPFTVDNLTATVQYDFYIQAVCAPGDESTWSIPTSATVGSYNMPVTGVDTVTTCSMILYDDGGVAGDYSVYCESTLILYPETAGNVITVSGDVNTESNYDFLRIFDGVGTSGTMLGEYSGTTTVPTLTSTTGPLTITFSSDVSIVYGGFMLTVACVPAGSVTTDPTVTTDSVSNLTQTAATLNATITNPDDVTIDSKGFEWKATSGGTYTPVTVTGNTFTYALTGLTANTSYTYKAFITFNGNTVYGDEVSFTTANEDTPTCPAPTGLTATVDHTDVTLTWQQEPNTATEWQINYRLATESTWSTATATSTTYTLTDLTANAQYVANVVAHCTNGLTSDESNTVTFETNNIGVEDYLAKAVTLYPNPATEMVSVAVSDANIMITGVEVYNVYGQLINTIVSTENPLRINVSGLADGMYYVRVTTDNGVVTKNFVKR